MVSILRRAKRHFYSLKALWLFVDQENESKYKAKLSKRIKYFFRGFNSDKYIAYDFKRNDHKLYLSDYRRFKMQSINGKYNVVFDNKLVFYNCFSNFYVIPRNIAYINRGVFSKLDSHSHDSIVSSQSLLRYIYTNKSLVLKPVSGGGGDGVFIIKSQAHKLYVNSVEADQNHLKSLIDGLDDYIVTEYVEQSAFSRELFDQTTNTIRVVMYRNVSTSKMTILAAMQRIGTSASKGLDNISSGGVSANINIETGEITKSCCFQVEGGKAIKISEKHPDTNQVLTGLKIPNWKYIRDDICTKMDFFPYIHYVGMDIVLTNEGYAVIEGNSYANPRGLQLNKPLLEDDDFKLFLQHHKI